jgi:hypothetical protein
VNNIVAEARGGKEDQKLFAIFNQIISSGSPMAR